MYLVYIYVHSISVCLVDTSDRIIVLLEYIERFVNSNLKILSHSAKVYSLCLHYAAFKYLLMLKVMLTIGLDLL